MGASHEFIEETIAVLVEDLYEDQELWYPIYRQDDW